MDVIIAGSGKLANSILKDKNIINGYRVKKWDNHINDKAIIIHTGSGRQLDDIINYCSKFNGILIQLSTGQEIKNYKNDFTIIECANLSILIVKFIFMMEKFGKLFHGYDMEIIESHQSNKKTLPGTANKLATLLGINRNKISSIRDKSIQKNIMKIPEEYLDNHAIHKISIKDSYSEIILETKVFGHEAYVKGLIILLNAVLKNSFEKKIYNIVDLLEMNLIK